MSRDEVKFLRSETFMNPDMDSILAVSFPGRFFVFARVMYGQSVGTLAHPLTVYGNDSKLSEHALRHCTYTEKISVRSAQKVLQERHINLNRACISSACR